MYILHKSCSCIPLLLLSLVSDYVPIEAVLMGWCAAVADVVAGVCDPAWYGSPVAAKETMRGWASAYAEVRPAG